MALGQVQARTLVLHNRRHAIIPFAHGQYLAEHIPHCELIELDEDTIALDAADPRLVDRLAKFLTGEEAQPAFDRRLTTVLFTDIVASTEQLADLGDRAWRGVLDMHDRVVRDLLRQYSGEEITTTGDGFVVCFDGPGRAIRCAQAIAAALGDHGIEIRAGLHTGECELRGGNIAGMAVHIAARVGALACAGEVLVTSTVRELVTGSGIEFDDRGQQQLKGVPNTWHLFATV